MRIALLLCILAVPGMAAEPDSRATFRHSLLSLGIFGTRHGLADPFTLAPAEPGFSGFALGISGDGTVTLGSHAYLHIHGDAVPHGRALNGSFLLGARMGPPVWGIIGAEYHRISASRHAVALDNFAVETERRAELSFVSSGLGLGSLDQAHLRAEALLGWYDSRHGSILRAPQFTGIEYLALDSLPIVGGRIGVHHLTIAHRLRLTTTLQYCVVKDIGSKQRRIPSPDTPLNEWRLTGRGVVPLNRHFLLFGETNLSLGRALLDRRTFRIGISFGT